MSEKINKVKANFVGEEYFEIIKTINGTVLHINSHIELGCNTSPDLLCKHIENGCPSCGCTSLSIFSKKMRFTDPKVLKYSHTIYCNLCELTGFQLPTEQDSGQYTYPFGKHAGRQLKDIPLDYLNWASKALEADKPKIANKVKKYLKDLAP